MQKILISEKGNLRITKKCCLENNKRVKLDGYKECVCSICGEKYLKYYSAKAQKCCSCREKLHLVKHGAAVVLREGFPKKYMFKTYKEIKEYYSGDELTCLLCGNGFESLPAHLASIHDISADSYKEMFGLPLSKGLVTDRLHDKLSKDCVERGIGKDTSAMKEMRKERHKEQRAANNVIKKHYGEIFGNAVKNNPNHVAKKNNMVSALCSLCGNVLERKITEYAVIVQGCNVLCEKCQRIKYIESQKRYAKKKLKARGLE